MPRLIGARAALEFMLKGSAVPALRAAELGIVDEVVDGDALERATALAETYPSKRRISDLTAIIAPDVPIQAAPFVVAQAHKMVPPENNGGFAAHKLIDAVQAAVELPFAFGAPHQVAGQEHAQSDHADDDARQRIDVRAQTKFHLGINHHRQRARARARDEA